MTPPLQVSSEEYVEENMASFPMFKFETRKNISCTEIFAEEPNLYLNILKRFVPFHFSGNYKNR